MTVTIREFSPTAWVGRIDGPGPEHARWNSAISPVEDFPGATLIGFASDEGVRRNHGRVGAADGPAAIRTALASLAIHDDIPRYDAGTIVVQDGALEDGQRELSNTVLDLIEDGHLVVALGGGHETAFGSHRGLRAAVGLSTIVNLDAHLNLRKSCQASSGTPFQQIAELEGEHFSYNVFGISRPNNTRALFDVAAKLGVGVTTDDELAEMTPRQAAEAALAAVEGHEHIHLSIDLDVLPACIAPGVSAPAAVGVDLARIRAIVKALACTGRLKLIDVVELNPRFDIDDRTAQAAARLIEDAISSYRQ
ncbi:formimidoylglutamase [Corynebacterium sp. A21]|uniref:formimidoylglutamase n=1 Tax=Corynebacterium sp. A21 TaxID=3457318 RepID=UPI003FCF2E0E